MINIVFFRSEEFMVVRALCVYLYLVVLFNCVSVNQYFYLWPQLLHLSLYICFVDEIENKKKEKKKVYHKKAAMVRQVIIIVQLNSRVVYDIIE